MDAASQSFRKEGTEPVSHTFAHPKGAGSETASIETVKPDSSKPSEFASGSDITDQSEGELPGLPVLIPTEAPSTGVAATAVSTTGKRTKSFGDLRGIFNRTRRNKK
jgi:hypothetical protein